MKQLRKILFMLILVMGCSVVPSKVVKASITNVEYTYTALDGSTVSTKADSNGKILIYLRTNGECINSSRVMVNLVTNPVENASILAVDADGAGRETVEAFAADLTTDQITYAYGENASKDMWDYAEAGGLGNSITYPLIVYIDGYDRIQKVTSGETDAAKIAERYEQCMNAEPEPTPSDPTKARELDVDKHTVGEIRDYITNSISMMNYLDTYKVTPVIKGKGEAGELSDESKELALAMLNQIRYIAGVNADVQLDEEYERAAQAGATITYMNYPKYGIGYLDHEPERPDGVDEDLYQLGYTGCSSSNLAAGYLNLSVAIVRGWMDDSDSKNIPMVGHRRWCLYPKLGRTGFGASRDIERPENHDSPAFAMYAFDKSDTTATQRLVAWPAQYTPKYCWSGTAWSLTTGYKEDIEKVQVQVTSLNDGKVWNLNDNSSDGYFNVDNGNYGDRGCVIFTPEGFTEGDAKDGARYKVHVSGLREGDIEYTVTFFRYEESESVVADDGTIREPQEPEKPQVELPGKVSWNSTALRNVSSGIELSWKSVKDANGYYIYRSENGNSYEKVARVKGRKTSSWIDEDAKSNGARYQYKIRAYKSVEGEIYRGEYSSKATIYRISRPSISSMKNVSGRKLTLTWKKNSKATGYEIQYATNSKFTSAKKVKIKDSKTVSTTLKSLTKNKNYYVRIRAVKTVDSKAYYSAWSAKKNIKISK